MNTTTTNWNRNEFKAYVLLYAANCGHIESRQERAYILSKVDKKTYENIHYELDADNDYQSIQKIISNIDRFDYAENELKRLTDEIMELFLADNRLDSVEQSIFMMLKKILKKT